MRAYFLRMFEYVAWADLRTIKAVRAMPAIRDKTLPILSHLLAAEHIWLARIMMRDPCHEVWPKLELEKCDLLAAGNAIGYFDFVGRLTTEGVTQSIAYRTTQGTEFIIPTIDILTQVTTHGPYHRGQIAKIIGQAGGISINTDFITFARETDKF
jgi:uncharacterized damage-inducible protein DinB